MSMKKDMAMLTLLPILLGGGDGFPTTTRPIIVEPPKLSSEQMERRFRAEQIVKQQAEAKRLRKANRKILLSELSKPTHQ